MQLFGLNSDVLSNFIHHSYEYTTIQYNYTRVMIVNVNSIMLIVSCEKLNIVAFTFIGVWNTFMLEV